MTVIYKDGSLDPFTGATYAGTSDAMILSNGGTNSWRDNFGARPDAGVGTVTGSDWYRRILLRFDITSLGGHFQTIESVTLRLYPSGTGGSETVNLYRLADANAGWLEGIGTSANGPGPEDLNGCTWEYKIYKSYPSVQWAGLAAGCGVAGTDYVATALASRVANSSTPLNAPFDLVFNDVSFIPTWASGGTNAGLFLRATPETMGNVCSFYTRENAATAMRPELIISYNPIPEPGSLLLLLALATPMLLVRRR